MATQFIVREGAHVGVVTDEETVTIKREQLEAIYDEIGDLLGLRG